MKRKHKQYFIYYIKDNVLIFDVFDYIEELAADYVDYCYDWNLLKDNIVVSKPIRIKEYINLYITDAILKINSISEKHNCKMFCYFYKKDILNIWKDYFEDPNKFIHISKKCLSKRLPNFIETVENNLFECVNGTFNSIPTLIPSGEDEGFILKYLKKLL